VKELSLGSSFLLKRSSFGDFTNQLIKVSAPLSCCSCSSFTETAKMPWIPCCVECGSNRNPCHCRILGPTLGFVGFVVAAVIEWPVGALVWCFNHHKGRRIMHNPANVVYPHISSIFACWRAFTLNITSVLGLTLQATVLVSFPAYGDCSYLLLFLIATMPLSRLIFSGS
jgi:hypothetical protein